MIVVKLGIVSINTVLARVIFPVLAVGLAMTAGERGWGLCSVLGVSGWVVFGPPAIAVFEALLTCSARTVSGPWTATRP